MVKTIKIQDALKLDCAFVDTRTSKEFDEAHIPGAINLPIFSNDERALVGTLYTKVGREQAIVKGLEYFLPKTKEIISVIDKINKPVVVYCWRGGMRSRGVVTLFSEDREIYQLEGGHKAYRGYVRDRLSKFHLNFKIVLLCGMTGSGKTLMLKNFQNALDLEGLANHRGSLFGGVGLRKRSQIMFEALLLQELERLNKYDIVIVEGESRKIGENIIPEFLFNAMRHGIKVFLNVDIYRRVDNSIKEYWNDSYKDETIRVLKGMENRLGKKNVTFLIESLEKNEISEVVKFLLERYYDPLYQHTMKDFKFDVEIKDIEGLKGFIKCL